MNEAKMRALIYNVIAVLANTKRWKALVDLQQMLLNAADDIEKVIQHRLSTAAEDDQ